LASDLLVATRSLDKLDEIRAVVGTSARCRMVTLRDIGIEPAPEEDSLEHYDTFVENALAKARYFAALTGMRTLADDSGLLVDALQGGPGVRTKRFAIDHGYVPRDVAGKPLDEANNRLLLEKLAGIDARGAHYMSAVALIDADRTITAVGTCTGEITTAPRGSGGFGYDPLFYIPALAKTFAELSLEEKNIRSHRAVAMRAIAPHLK
jgi:XTP/dITP diphosphohydrolase